MEQKRKMGSEYGRDQGWKRGGRGEGVQQETRDKREEGIQQRQEMEERRKRGREYSREERWDSTSTLT